MIQKCMVCFFYDLEQEQGNDVGKISGKQDVNSREVVSGSFLHYNRISCVNAR